MVVKFQGNYLRCRKAKGVMAIKIIVHVLLHDIDFFVPFLFILKFFKCFKNQSFGMTFV